MEQVQVERDYYGEMQRIAEKTKKESSNSWIGKTAVVKDMEKTNPKSKFSNVRKTAFRNGTN